MNNGGSSLRIALIGYGKMGKAIEEIALERGHNIALRINRSNLATSRERIWQMPMLPLNSPAPHSALDNVRKCLEMEYPRGKWVHGMAGTTSWIRRLCEEKNGLFYMPVISVGVNIFFELNKKLAMLMSRTG